MAVTVANGGRPGARRCQLSEDVAWAEPLDAAFAKHDARLSRGVMFGGHYLPGSGLDVVYEDVDPSEFGIRTPLE